jgi:hypothetical protein
MRKITLSLTLLCFSLLMFAQNQWIKLNPALSEDYKIEIIEQSANEMTIKLSINAYRLDEVTTPRGTAFVVKTPECRNSYQKGAPDLPFVTEALAIPDHGGYKYEVISSNFSTINNIDIAPSKGTIYRNVDPATVPYEYGREYNFNDYFPLNRSTMSDPYILRDVRGSNITFLPFSYNAINKELRIYNEIIVKIKFNNDTFINEISSVKATRDADFNGIYDRTFLNYKTSSKYTALDEGTPGNILIIAKDTYASAMDEYINWKREKGIETEMVLMSAIGTTSAQVKTYIQNYYNTNDLTYVLLVGDAADVPIITISGQDTDNGYTYLAGSDGYADIFIGRFSGNSLADIQTQVDRTVHYEKELSTADTWLENALGSASNEGDGAGHDGGESDAEHMDNIKTDLENFGYTVTSVYQDGGSNAQITAAVNNGIGIGNYVGHGDVTLWANTSFSNTNVNALNNAKKLAFYWSVACVNGDFNGNTCFAEAWLRATNGGNATGAVAFLASTINQSWVEPMTGQDEMVDILLETYPTNIKRTMGGVSFNGMFLMIEEGGQGQSMADTWTLFGDPSLMLRSKTPEVMTINHQSTITVGQTTFQVNCDVNGALVSLTKLNGEDVEIIGTGYVSGGSVTVDIEAFTAPGNMLVTVTSFNKVTYQEDVLVIVPDGPYVIHDGYTIDDSDGNNNGVADYNEMVYINQTLTNVGIEVAEGVNTVFSISNPGVIVNDNNESFFDITVSETVTMDMAYTITIPDGIADQTNLAASLVITDNNSNEWTAEYIIPVNAPAMQLSFIEVDDSDSGNNNGTLDAGETVNLVVEVINDGHAASVAGNVTISSTNEYVTINTNSVSIGAQNVNSPATISFEVVIDESIPTGTSVCFDFDLLTGMYTAELNSCLPAGLQIEDWESNTMTSYEWENSATYPWTIVTNEVYEGTYALKSGSVPSTGGESILIINLDVLNNDNVEFYKKVSCEQEWWGTMYDYLAFSIDGSEKDKWCGEVDWSMETYPVSAGERELKWLYTKDDYVDEGSDCAWIDNIKLPAHQTSISIINNPIRVNENTVEVYPNPASEVAYLNVNLTNDTKATVKVMNYSGQVVYEYSNEFNLYSGTNSIILNTSDFAAGLYIVNITTSENTYNKNLIISK